MPAHEECTISSGISCIPAVRTIRAQLFEGRLALNLGLNLTLVSFSCAQKSRIIFSVIFIELPIINRLTKRINTEMLFKISNLNSNLALRYHPPSIKDPPRVDRR